MLQSMSLLFFFISSLFTTDLIAQPAPGIQLDDFKPLSGLYQGTLTYRDYSSDKIVTLQTVSNVSFDEKSMNIKILINEWGKDYTQNYNYKIKNGALVNNGAWDTESIDKGEEGKLRLVVTQKGKDGNKNRPCIFRVTFDGDDQHFSITKEVRFLDEADFFIRNRYTFQRINELNPDTSDFK